MLTTTSCTNLQCVSPQFVEITRTFFYRSGKTMAPIIPKIFVIYQSATNCSAIKLNFLPGLINKNHNSIRHSRPKCPYQDFLPSPVFFIMVLEALSQKFRPNDFAESVEKLHRKVTTWKINLENKGRSLRVEVKKIKS